jgi:hypothetical protein
MQFRERLAALRSAAEGWGRLLACAGFSPAQEFLHCQNIFRPLSISATPVRF